MNLEKNHKILPISKFAGHPVYQELHNKCIIRYNDDVKFRQNCNESSAMVLKGYTTHITPSMLDTAAQYILGELPFYMDTPNLLDVNFSFLTYHLSTEFFTNLYQNERGNFISQNQGHVILKFVI